MDNKTILLTGARAPVTLHLSRLLHGASHKVMVAESFPYHLGKYSNSVSKSFLVPKPKQETKEYISELKRIIIEEKIDILIPTCEEIFYISKYKYELTPHCEVLVDDFENMKMLYHQYDFIEYVKAENRLYPNTYLVTSKEEMAAAMELHQEKVVLKPVYSKFSTKTKVMAPNSIQVVYDLTVTPECPWVVQEFISGKQFSSYTIVQEGKVIAHSLYERVYTASHGQTIAFSHVSHQGIFNWISSFVRNLNYTGQISFDFIVDARGNIYPSDCKPRATSGLHLFTRRDFIGVFTEDLYDIRNPKSSTRTMNTLAMIFYGKKDVQWLKTFLTSKDVLFSWSDIRPFFYQFYSFYQLQRISNENQIDITESPTYDIEWNGEEL